MHPFFRLRNSFRQDLAYLATSDAKKLWLRMKLITLNKQCMIKPSPRCKLMTTLGDPIPQHCSVRQGCPMSRLLFALVLNPRIYLLERHLTGIRTGHRTTNTEVVAHADEVTTFVGASADMQVMRDLLLTCERTSGACWNIRKSKAMVAGSWDTSTNTMDIPYFPEITILGLIHEYSSPFRERHLVEGHSESQSPGERRVLYGPMSKTTNPVRACLLLSKKWHTAQIFPASNEHGQ